MFNWLIGLVLGAIVAFVLGLYMAALGLPLASIITLCFLVAGYTSAVVVLLTDED